MGFAFTLFSRLQKSLRKAIIARPRVFAGARKSGRVNPQFMNVGISNAAFQDIFNKEINISKSRALGILRGRAVVERHGGLGFLQNTESRVNRAFAFDRGRFKQIAGQIRSYERGREREIRGRKLRAFTESFK